MKVRCFCPELSWEEFAALDLKEMDLSGRTFYTAKLPMVSHFPMNPEIKIEKTLKEIQLKGYETVSPLLALFEDGLFMGRVMIEIVCPSTKAENVETSNNLKLVGRIFSGPKYLVPKALKEFDRHLMSQQLMTTEFYFWYHSCKKCEKEKGDRTVILGRIK